MIMIALYDQMGEQEELASQRTLAEEAAQKAATAKTQSSQPVDSDDDADVNLSESQVHEIAPLHLRSRNCIHIVAKQGHDECF